MSTTLADTELSALFGIDLAESVSDLVDVATIMCGKCHGTGKFIGRNGRALGPCFTCSGAGVARGAGVALQPGQCVKCVGTGEFSRGRPCFACHGTGREVEAAPVTVTAIADAFAAAQANGIARPKLRLDDFVFSLAPATGRNAGAIYVKIKSTSDYLGKIADGKFHRAIACDDPTAARVIVVAGAPHEAAKAYGQRTGSCSCCGRELTNHESIDLGIGPICRDKFGW
jgi:hypothetical protein